MDYINMDYKNTDYKEKLEKAKELYPTANADQRYVLECLFPELAESEDERIRKEILNVFKQLGKDTTICGRNYDYAKWISWLEKQGHTDGIIEKAKTEKQRVIITETDGNANIDWDTRSFEDARKLLECGLQYINTELEKQGNKETLCDKCREEQPSHSCQDITANGRCYIEGMNTSNNVKPKFKVGDILKHNKANIVCKVLSANVGFYSLISILGGDEMELSNVEKNFHLWTIKDAKDGDVLQLGTVTAIFKKYIGQEKCICYCSIDEDGVFEIPIEDGEDNIYGCTNTTPATKEQRDTLFAKMKEAGYEWFAGLRELRKLPTPADVGFEELGKVWAEEANKQSLANSAKTCKKSQRMVSAEAKEALYDKPATIDIDKMVYDYANNKERGNEEFGKPVNCMIRAYRQGLNDAVEKIILKPVWSEEDETGWTNTMIMIKEVASNHYTKDSVKLVIDWLKSIKQRIKGE